MSVHVINNTIGDPQHGASVQKAVLESIGQPDGDWRVYISEPPGDPGYTVRIKGPNDKLWSRRFFGIEEQDGPDYAFIRRTVSEIMQKFGGGEGR